MYHRFVNSKSDQLLVCENHLSLRVQNLVIDVVLALCSRLMRFVPHRILRNYSHVKSSEMFPMPEHKRPLGICEVVLGPESDDLMELGVREFLDENGLQGVPIKRSAIPYRT